MPRSRSRRVLIDLAGYLRDRLTEIGRVARHGSPARTPARTPANRQAATLIVAAAAPFASSPYARARLLRQMHAAGLLTERECAQANDILRVAQ